MIWELMIIFAAGAFLFFVGLLQIGNVRHALKTGIIAVGIRDTSRVREFHRDKTPLAYQLNFWPSLFAAILLPVTGMAAIGYGIALVFGYLP